MTPRTDAVVSRRVMLSTLGIIMLAAAVAQGFGRFTFGVVLPAVREDLLDGSNTLAGLLGTANTLAYLAGALLVGSLAARVRPLSLMRLGLILSVAGIALAAVAPNGWVLGVGLVSMGLGGAAIWIPSPGLATTVVSVRRRGVAVGMMGSGVGLGIVFAGQLNNVVVGQGGSWRGVYGIEALLGAVTLLLVFLVLRSSARAGSQRGGFGGFGVLGAMTGWRPLTLCYAVFGFGYLLVVAFVVARLEDDAGFTSGRASAVFAVLGACTVFGGITLGRISDVIGRRRALVGGYITFALASLLLLTDQTHWVILGAIGCGILFGGIPTVIAAYIIDRTDETSYGQTYAAATFAFGLAQVAAPQAGGLIADWRGSFTLVFLLSAAVMSSGSLIALGLPRDHGETASIP